nr:DUF4397 domain-containing protein [candidate division Zixibacteria bacterium]
MLSKRIIAGFTAIVLGLIFVAGCSDDDNNPMKSVSKMTSSIRVIHASYDAPEVDIRVDGTVAIGGLGYGQSSGYAEISDGVRNISVTPAGANSPVVIEADLDLEVNTSYTVFAVNNLGSIEPVVAVDDRSQVQSKAKVRFLHASPDAPAVDIKLNSGDGPTVFVNKAFKDITEYAEVDPGSYTFVVTPSGDNSEVLIFEPINVTAGVIYTAVAHGTLDNTDLYDLAVRIFVDNNDGDLFVDLKPAVTKVLVAHASPDAPGVDLLIDDLVINNTSLTFPNNTGYLDVNAGDRGVKVNVSGSMTTVINAGLNLDAGMAYSIFAVNSVSNIEPLVLVDDLTTPAAGMAHIRFLHLSPDAPAVDITLTDDTVVFGNKAFRDYTSFTPLNAGLYDLQVRAAGTSMVILNLPGINLEDGKIYTVFAKGFLAGSGDTAIGAAIIVNN